MRFTNKHNIFISFLLLFVTKTSSQTVTPHILNMGGGYSESFKMEWSIGESASISNFLNINNGLNTGVLQPKSRFRKLTNPNVPNVPEVLGSQIIIYPNVTSNIVNFKGNFINPGNLEIQLVQNNSFLISTHNPGKVFGNHQTSFSLEKYPDGLFYIKVYFKPEQSDIIVGIYKVIKVSK